MSSPIINSSKERSLSLVRLSRLWMAIILGALASFGSFSIDMYLPALPKLTGDLQTSTSLAQVSLSACLLGLSLGQLIAGSVSDIRGRRMPLLIGLIIYAAASIFCVFSTSIWVLIGLRFIQVMAGAAGIVISRAIVRDLYSGTELTKFFTLLMLVNGIAPIIAPIIGMLLTMILIGAGLIAILIPLFVIVSCVGIVGATSFTLAMKNYGESAGSAAALLGLLLFIFGGIVAPLVGLGGSGTAVPMGIVIAASEVVAIASYFLMVRPRKGVPNNMSD